ncbi:MAG: DcrB-related protein [Minisyncoccales bacterium]
MNKELVDYIKQQLSVSVSRNKIVDILLEQGWHQAEIDEAFSAAEGDAIRENGGTPRENEFDGAVGDGGGRNKKILLAAGVAVLVLAMIFAVAASFMGKGEKKEAAPLLDQEPPAAESSQTETVATEDEQVDPAVIDEISRLEQTITPPLGWTSRQAVVSYRPMALFFKPEQEKDDAGNKIFNEVVNIVRDNLLSKEEEYLAKAKGLLQSEIENYKSLSERKINLSDGSPATLIEGSFTQKEMAVRSMQLYAAKDNRIYILSGVVLAKNWDAEKDVIGAALMSFKFPEY